MFVSFWLYVCVVQKDFEKLFDAINRARGQGLLKPCLRCYQVILVSVPTLSKLTILRCSSIRSTGKRLSLGSTRSYKPQPSMLCLAILMKSNLRWKSWKPMARCKRRCPCSSLVVVLVHVVGDSLQVDQIFNCPENHLYDFSICKETTDTRDESFFQLWRGKDSCCKFSQHFHLLGPSVTGQADRIQSQAKGASAGTRQYRRLASCIGGPPHPNLIGNFWQPNHWRPSPGWDAALGATRMQHLLQGVWTGRVLLLHSWDNSSKSLEAICKRFYLHPQNW